MTENLMKDIEEAIARGKNPPDREPQQYQPTPFSIYGDAPVARDTTVPKKTYPYEWKGDMKFTRKMKYESDWDYMIRQVPSGYMITTLHTDKPIDGAGILADPQTGEPKYFIYRGAGSQRAMVYTIKLDGDMFTEKQKTAWKKEIRSTKIAKLQLEIEGLKNEVEASKNDLKAAEETIGDLKTANEELTNTLKTSIHERLKKLLLHEKPE